jgi:hypothetical protein
MAQHLENLFENNFNYILDEEWVMMVEFHPFFIGWWVENILWIVPTLFKATGRSFL